ncbi:hypothetical protein AAFF_G00278970 [Aldrovandia affinis]|uniref:Uncharacterized protein n=1 Tax=Aldrovandia affinis TaxID=143900 RepID=A0AAD7WSF3_9TELE|nr:hypothetical protein AAFF_G00278970 [Aldrovandia affinis]
MGKGAEFRDDGEGDLKGKRLWKNELLRPNERGAAVASMDINSFLRIVEQTIRRAVKGGQQELSQSWLALALVLRDVRIDSQTGAVLSAHGHVSVGGGRPEVVAVTEVTIHAAQRRTDKVTGRYSS